MARLRAYTFYKKTCEQIRRLHDVTIHSYQELYDDGRELIKERGRNARITLRTDSGGADHPLDVLTYHARDVYPGLLRSTLLVRLTSAFEVFLVDTVEEIADRSLAPFETDHVLKLTERQLLNLYRKNEIVGHIVRRATRQLTNRSISDTRKFYRRHLGIELTPSEIPFSEVEEIYDRRHLYVHRAGYVDPQYLRKYPASSFPIDTVIPVTEEYLVDALALLDRVALHIKRAVEASYSIPGEWKRRRGDVQQITASDRMFHIALTPANPGNISHLLDLEREIVSGVSLAEITVWTSTNGENCRLVVTGPAEVINPFIRDLYEKKRSGEIKDLETVKVLDGARA